MQPVIGILLKVLSALAFTLMAATIKLVSDAYPVGQLIFFRSAFALVPLLIWLAWSDRMINAVRTHNLRGHLLRSIIGVTGMFCGFAALGYLPLSDAVAIGYAAPLIVVVLAALLLKETVRAYRWSAVGIGFVGVILMLTPQFGVVDAGVANENRAIGATFAIFAALCTAGATIQVRRLTATERTGAIVFYFSLFSTLAGLATIAFGWAMPGLADFAILVVIGVLGGIGQILLTQSYRFGDASLIAPFEYTTMIWALLLGWFVFGDWPQAIVLTGAAIVIAAGIFVIWREHRLGLARKKSAEMASKRAI
ncbi:MAG: DMT family transporter [Salinarimonas sp.]|nr:DMT family transporter [Salinarimonas sp.]